MGDLTRIDPAPFGNRLELAPANTGPRPQLKWIPISNLRVDASYQRQIHGRGAKNIRDIASSFDWTKFGTVIVAAVAADVFAIIDGQHRTTAAALRGLPDVPCQVVDADRATQARAFEAINAHTTAISPMQLHAARLAAGNADAMALDEACAAADVTICRYPVPAKEMKPGQTLAAGKLAQMLRLYGRDVLVAALRCITQTRKGNVGMVRQQVVGALCAAFEAEPDWYADDTKLLRAMQKFDFAAQYRAAGEKSFREGGSITAALVEAVSDHLDEHMESRAA